jgi:hypothetical protein
MSQKPFQIRIFGKAGCQKCKVLQGRLETLLQKPEYAEFEQVYHDVETEEGMVSFSLMECLNPQRIPAFVVTRDGGPGRRPVPLPNPRPGQQDEVCGQSRLFQYLGLQTDYSDVGKGVITPKMIGAVLYDAKELAG